MKFALYYRDMRIIAGSLGSRRYEAPKNKRTHPMSNKVKGALFNSLGDITGKRILDTFAGSGALTFEALSRGAAFSVAIEADAIAHKILKSNLVSLGLEDKCQAVRANVFSWSDNNARHTFPIVIAAPPYDKLQPHILSKLARHVARDGLLVLDWPGKKEPFELLGMRLADQKKYGDAQLLFYRLNSGSELSQASVTE